MIAYADLAGLNETTAAECTTSLIPSRASSSSSPGMRPMSMSLRFIGPLEPTEAMRADG